MARELFITPDTTQLPLFDDGQYWIVVKRQLTAGESKQLYAAGIRRMSSGTDGQGVPGYEVDLASAAFEKVALYLLDWNLTEHAKIDTPKAMRDTLKALTPEVFNEIERAISVHVLAQQEKKLLSKTPEIAPT